MKKFSAALFAVLAIGLAIPASAEEPTEAQIEELKQLVTSVELERFLAEHRPKTSTVEDDGTFEVTMSCGTPFAILAASAGITSNHLDSTAQGLFLEAPDCREGARVHIKACYYRRLRTSKPIMRAMDSDGFRPATLREALLFRAQADNPQEHSWVMLGSRYIHPEDPDKKYGGMVAVIDVHHGLHPYVSLDFQWFDFFWPTKVRHPCVRK